MAKTATRSSEFGHHKPTMRDVARMLSDIHTHVLEQRKLLERMMHMSKDQLALLKRMDDATTNIAADIQRLKGTIVPGMSDVEVAEAQAALDAVATRLEAVANDPENPDPEAPPTA